MPRGDMIVLRRDTLANWAAAEVSGPALAAGERGYITDLNVDVVGDGAKKVAQLVPVGSGTYVRTVNGTGPDGNGNVAVAGGGGGTNFTPTVRTGAYTASAGDLVLANAASAGFTVALPASPTTGQQVAVKKTDATANVVTVAAAGKTIDGDANATIVAEDAGAIFTYDGTNWQVTAVMQTAVSGGGGAVSSVVGQTGAVTGTQILADTNVAAALAAKAASSHAHAASDVTSGTLPLTRGGTGGTDAATARTSLGVPASADVQLFTSNGTWTKPSGAKTVFVWVVGAGGGGGSGRLGAAGSARGGGGGGGGGSTACGTMQASLLPATVSVTVGSGGSGGAAVSANDTNGNAGSNGGLSMFGSNGSSYTVYGGQGLGGGGGTTSGGSTGGVQTGVSGVGSIGGVGGAASNAGNGNDATSGLGATGGGGGGGLTAADAVTTAGSGGRQMGTTTAAVLAVAGVNGTTTPIGFDVQAGWTGAHGGGGGGAHASNAGQAGATGGSYGGGGGGGAASVNGVSSGAGGAGGPGAVLVITYF